MKKNRKNAKLTKLHLIKLKNQMVTSKKVLIQVKMKMQNVK